MFDSYLNHPEATSTAFDDDGYYLTGDVMHTDNQGNYFIHDRKKELIKVNGFPVAPAEIEGVLIQIPGVLDAGVHSIPDQLSGEVPVAHVVLDQGVGAQLANIASIKDTLKVMLAEYKMPKVFVLQDDIPKAASGKILRNKLKY